MKGIRWLLVAALMLLPAYSHALGLGRLKVHSALNEPLNAEVEFTSISDKELRGLNASLATRADFEQAGIERQPYLSTIKFTVAKRLDGRYILQLQTDQPLVEPFLHFLLQIEWPGGRVVREYSALIDPPVQISGKPPQVETPPAGEAPGKEPATPATETIPEQVAATPAPVEPAPAEATTPAEAPLPTTAESAPPVVETSKPAPGPKPVEKPPVASKPPVMPEPPTDIVIDKDTGWPIIDGGVSGVSDTAPPAPGPAVEKLDAAPQPEVATAAPEKPEAGARPAPEPSVPSTSPAWARVAEYHVKPGDTMWVIADRVRTDKKLALEQVVLAIYRSNRAAFFGNNVNNLRAGKILKIPEREAIDELPLTQARKEFRAQYDVWQEYKLKLASADRALKVPDEAARQPESPAPAPVPVPETKKPEVKAEAKPEAKPEPKPEAAKPAPKPAEKPAVPVAGRAPQDELLRIVRANIKSDQKKGTPDKKVVETEAVKDNQERQALAERVASLEESVISRQIQAKDLSDKIGAVRAQLKREKRLMELESQRLAEATRKPEPAPTPAETKPEVKAEAKPEPKPEAQPAPKPDEKADTKPAAPVKEPAKPAEVVKAPPRRVTPAPAPAPVAAEEKGFVADMMDTVLGSDLMPVFMGVIVLLSGGIAVLYLRRRRRAIGEFEESILSTSEGTTDQPPMTTDTSGQAVPAGDTSFLSDFSQGGMGGAHTDDVDPVAEAEVYLAYGRDETAEEILKDAIVKNPERNELKVKLLEIYHQRNDVRAFETLAEELYAGLGGRANKLWDKVQDMGRKLNPDNPMFRGGAPAAGSKPPKEAAGGRTMPAFGDTTRSMSSPTFTAPVGGGDTGTVDFGGSAKAATPPAGSETSIDFDIGAGAPASEESLSEAVSPPEAGEPDLGLGASDSGLGDFDIGQPAAPAGSNSIDFDMGGVSPSPAEPEAPAPTAGGGLDFDFGAAAETGGDVAVAEQPSAGTDTGTAQWDETATKLDLAKAYIDMGDAEGARSILDEVMNEGNDSQKKQAKELAAQLG